MASDLGGDDPACPDSGSKPNANISFIWNNTVKPKTNSMKAFLGKLIRQMSLYGRVEQ